MKVTHQLTFSVEKADRLRARLQELKKTAVARRLSLEKELTKTKDADRKRDIEAELELAKETELDVSITNLLRASLDFAMEKFLIAPDITLIAALHASKATRGRPRGRR